MNLFKPQKKEMEMEINQLKFTILDILNDIIYMKPLFLLFKKTSLVKNYDKYNILKKDLLEKLQIQKIVKQMIMTKNLDENVNIIRNYIVLQPNSK